MFDGIRNMMGMLKNLPQMKERMEQLQQRMGQITADGQAGGDMVSARVNGRMELVSVKISEDADVSDREMLGDLVVSAVNQAMVKVREAVAAETAQLVPGMPGAMPDGQLPPG